MANRLRRVRKELKRLAPLALILLLAFAVFASDRIPNISRIARAWNSIPDTIKQHDEAMGHANRLVQERFNPKILVANPDEKRRETVGHYKAAKEALLKELDALNELIDEEDY